MPLRQRFLASFATVLSELRGKNPESKQSLKLPIYLAVPMCSFVKFFPRRDGHSQPVLFRGKRACGIRSHRARRIVGAIEIDEDMSIFHRTAIKKAASRISIVLRRQIVKHEEQTRFRIAP